MAPGNGPVLSQRRVRAVISLIVITPVGIYTKLYGGVGSEWVSSSLAGVLYEIFWCILVFAIVRRSRPAVIAVCVFVATSLLEVLQLWHPPFLEWLRSSVAGAAVLGVSFDAWDFPHYLLGCFIGWLWMKMLQGLGRDWRTD